MRVALAALLLPLTMMAASTPASASAFGTLFAGSPPSTLGVHGGRLAPCPERPNCVSSRATDAGHAVAALQFRGDAAAAMATLARVIRAEPRATVIAATPGYLHAEFASAAMGFVDDVEFALDPAAGAIEVRSAARLGYYDFGVNRKRIEALAATFAAMQR